MGEGLVSVFAIVDALYDSSPGNCIVIDEPELSLHPNLQKRVAALLKKFSQDRQIIVSTHSPYFVDLAAINSGGNLARVTTTVEDGTQIWQMTPESTAALKLLTSDNLNNPHVFGLDARELFFQEDRIILTEGQHDVLLYPRVAEEVGVPITGNFFGWGVGGAGNMKHLCAILQSLGFSKVAGLLDSDQLHEFDKLKALFPEYGFWCIPAPDIKTKGAENAKPSKMGLLDDSYKIRPQFAADTKIIFDELKSHLT